MSNAIPRMTHLRQFLTEQIAADAPWAVIVDQLDESLHEDAIKLGSGLE